MTDERILMLLQQRDEQGILLLQEQYGGYCHSILYSLLRDEEAVQEELNDLWLRIWNAVPPAEPKPLKPYLAKAARNAALNRLAHDCAQKRGSVSLLLDELAEVLPDRAAEANADARALTQCLNRFLGQLPMQERQLFLQRYWFGRSVRELAELLGKNERSVATRLFRTRKRLKKFLEKEGYEL